MYNGEKITYNEATQILADGTGGEQLEQTQDAVQSNFILVSLDTWIHFFTYVPI